LPKSHEVHADIAGQLANEPTGQGMHAKALAIENEPAVQLVQIVEPGDEAIEPAAQGRHAVRPCLDW